MDQIIDRIRKLITLGEGGANEHESRAALEAASRLMMQHGLDRDVINQASSAPSEICGIYVGRHRYAYRLVLGLAASKLMGTVMVVSAVGPETDIEFVGRKDNVTMTAELFNSLLSQIEVAYKRNLPKSMTVSERGKWRRQFKASFSHAVIVTVNEIIEAQSKPASDGTSLVLHRDALQREIDDALSQRGITDKSDIRSSFAQSTAGVLGYINGQAAELQHKVK